ncbi:MAG TPA: response regulator, partial [Ktedonobacteraceae bacterium]|nr:response regulator [Ktedonobacteraceae bacterium]
MERHPTRVLLIEDDEDDYMLLQKVLAKIPDERYELLWEHAYEGGLASMLAVEHDISMVDYRLGASNGIELLKAAREQGYRRPIILLTGAEGNEIDIQALQAGADDYVAKGQLQGELLQRIIRYAIERKKAEHEREKFLSEQIATREMEQRRTEFIGMVVHELKTPLTSLKGYAQLLLMRFS